MGFVQQGVMFALRTPYGKLATPPDSCAGLSGASRVVAQSLRERDWLVLAYLTFKSVDPRSSLAKGIVKRYEQDPDKFSASGQVLPGWVCRPMDELVSNALGKDCVTSSTIKMAMDSLRRLEHWRLLRIHGARRNGKMPLTELLVIERAEELGIPVPWLKRRPDSSAPESSTDLAGNVWDEPGGELSTSWAADDD